MVRINTSEEWQRQSSLLLQARPTTTRITTKYTIPNLDSAKYQRVKKRKKASESDEKEVSTTAPRVPRATLTLKTYDPESGVALIFKTDRAAEVGRLISGLGRLGRHMAALPQKTEDVTMEDAAPAAQVDAPEPTATSNVTAAANDGKGQPAPSGGGGKKKKKGKK